MRLKLQPQDMRSEPEQRHFQEAVKLLRHKGWGMLLLHYTDGTVLLTDEYIESPDQPAPNPQFSTGT